MSRRKQAKPQCVHLDAHQVSAEHLDYSVKHISSPPCDVHVCERCCAEFFNLPDLQEHQTSCSKNPLVLIVSENGSPASPSLSFTFGSPLHNVEEPMNDSMSNEDSEGLHDFSKDKTPEANKESTLMSEANSCDNGVHSRSDNENSVGNGSTSTTMLASVFSSVLPQADSPPELGNVSSTSSNVFIENLESTSVAVAQFNQEVSVKAEVSSSSPSSCPVAFPGLIEQLITLQQQQVKQLKLIEEIQHQILLLAAQSTETSASSSICQGSAGIPHASPLIKLSSHLSQQLAAAAGLAQSLASQSARISNVKQLKHADLSSHHDSTEVLSSTDISQMTDTDRSKLLISRLGTYPPKKQCTPDSTPYRQGGATNSPSHFLKTDSIKKFSLPHSPTGNHIFSKTLPSIGEIVEDLNALTALAQQRKGKLHNLTSFEYKRPFDEGLFKHKCRFCAKVFGSDSALQIHLRSHTGERPYKCNICGNRFSTRGNLKVHFQRHKEKYPDIQMNPYPVPEHLDNVPTSTGIPYGMSMPPNKPIFNWLDSKSSVTNLTGLLLPSSLPSLPSVIKTEEQMVLIDRASSNLNGFDTFERRTKNKDEFSNKHFLTIDKNIPVSINTVKDGLETNTSVDSASTNVNSLIPLLSEDFKPKLTCGGPPDSIEASETTKLQQLVENIDRKCTGSESNECMVCHRVLSCQSALKMHYRTHTGERPFKCRLCGRAFTTKGNLKTHYSIHRAMPPLKVQHSCPICQDKFTNAMILQQHIRMHMVGHISNMTFPGSYQDTIKHDIFSVERKNLDDQRSVLDENMEITEAISDSKASTSPLESLCSSPTSAQTFESENQIKVLQENDLLNDKLENGPMGGNSLILRSSSVDGNVSQRLRSPVLSEATSFCSSLSPQSSAVENDKSHTYETHHRGSIELTSTDFLQSNFTGANSLESMPADILKDGTLIISPTRDRGLIKSNACDICNKTFACQSALDIHYRSHTKERPFICTVCNRGFSTKGNLKQHMLTHQMRDLPSQLFEQANQSHHPQPNSPHQLIASKINMEANNILNRDGKDSIVGTCSSPSLPVLAAPPAPPRRTPKQHFCHTCGKMFSSSSALQIHERTHTGEKPFSCTICGRAFTTKGNLKVHMGTHMWNCPPARRGRRLSINDPIKFLKSNPVKVPETLPKDSISGVCNGDSTNVWNQYATTALANGLETKPNEISVIQNGGIQHLSVSVGNGRNPPMDGLTENLEKRHNVYVKTSLPWLEKLGESRTSLNFTQLIEDSKTD